MKPQLLENECAHIMTDHEPTYGVQNAAGTKKCPFCAEQIQLEAIKCRYCGEFLDVPIRTASTPPSQKWYNSTGTIVIALLCLGPLALPLVWVNRRYKPLVKLTVTIAVLVATVGCTYYAIHLYEQLMEQFEVLRV